MYNSGKLNGAACTEERIHAMIKKIASIGVVGLVLVASVVAGVMTPSFATRPTQPQGEHKVTICHATNSASNPYEMPTVDYAAVDGEGGQSDHMHHHGTGVIPSSEAHAEQIKKDGQGQEGKWDDIIPPVPGVTPGLNWTALGQAIWNNDCNYPKVATASVSETPATCQTGEKLVYGAATNATYSGTPNGATGPQAYNVVATANNDSLFAGNVATKTFTGTLDGKLSGPQCDAPVTLVASATVTVTPATCESPARLNYGALSNASFSGTTDGTTGPASYSVTATANSNALFTAGTGVSADRKTKTMTGTLDATLTGDECVQGETDTPTTPGTGIGSGETPDMLPETGAATPLALIAMIAGIVAVLTSLGLGLRTVLSRKF